MSEVPEWARGAASTPNPARPMVEGPGAQDRYALLKAPVEPRPPVETLVELSSVHDPEPLVIDGVVFPRIAAQRIRAMDAATRAQWDADRLRCKTDQLFLSSVLGYDLVQNPHAALFNLFLKKQPGTALFLLDTVVKKRMVLWPRGCAKTFSVRVEETQLILNYPAIRICFLTGGENLAKRQLSALKNVFKQPTPRFLYLFPEFCLISKKNKKGEWKDEEPDWGNAHEFSVPARGNTILAEPTVCLSTARSVNSGSHFDVIFIDDLVHDRNWQSGALLEKCYQDYLSICPLLDPHGYIVMTGTRYAPGDTYERIQENALEMGQASVWKFSIRDCWSTGCTNCSHSDVFHDRDINILEPPCTVAGCNCKGFASDNVKGVLFPQVLKKNGDPFGHTLEFLEKTLAEQGRRFFACQYLNKPEADGSQTFTDELIGAVTLFHENQLPPHGASTTYLMGDLAYSTSADRDESVIFAVQKFAGALYVWGCWFGRWSANDRVENIIQILKGTRPEIAYFEKNLNSDSLHLNIVSRAPEFGLYKIPIEWTPTSNHKDAKNIRIGDIEAAMKGKRLFLYAKMRGYDRLVQQLLKWPNIKHDDFADGLSLVVAAPTGWQHETIPQQPGTGPNWLQKLNQNAPVEDAYYDSGCGTGFCA
jgi:hypothetical protein